MCRGYVSLILLCAASRIGAVGIGASQAGEPIAVNVEYDVPEFGSKDAAVRAQLGSDLEAKLTTKSSLRAGAGHRSGSPFSAFALRASDGDVVSQGTAVTVHVPSPSGPQLLCLPMRGRMRHSLSSLQKHRICKSSVS